MSTNQYAISAYRSANRTLPPLTAVVMCYDDILTRIGNAAAAGTRNDFESQYNEVYRATRILTGLTVALDLDRGGDVAARLKDLYTTLIISLNRLVGKADAPAQYQQIAEALIETRNAWAEIAGTSPRNLPKTPVAS